MNITYNTVYIIQQAHCQDVPIRGSINLQCDMFFFAAVGQIPDFNSHNSTKISSLIGIPLIQPKSQLK